MQVLPNTLVERWNNVRRDGNRIRQCITVAYDGVKVPGDLVFVLFRNKTVGDNAAGGEAFHAVNVNASFLVVLRVASLQDDPDVVHYLLVRLDRRVRVVVEVIREVVELPEAELQFGQEGVGMG